jgi:hypothetical protein
VVGGVTVPIFHGGTLLAQRRAALSTYRASRANYEQTVLQEFQLVGDVLDALTQDEELVAAEQALLASPAEDESGTMKGRLLLPRYGWRPVKRMQCSREGGILPAASKQLRRFVPGACSPEPGPVANGYRRTTTRDDPLRLSPASLSR